MKKTSIIFLLFIVSNACLGQNYVNNGSFEDFDEQYILTFDASMKGWQNVAWFPRIFNIELCDKYEFYEYRDKVVPFEGNTMVQMKYHTAGECRNFTERGASDYIGTKLKEPLKVGKKYKISFWIYIPTPTHTEFTKFIGFSLLRKPINYFDGLIFQNTFYLEKIIYNKWYEASWIIQPTCELRFPIIGVFQNKNRPPIDRNTNGDNLYYIDKVEITEVDKKVNAQEVTLFCKENENFTKYMSPELPKLSCFFESSHSSLTNEEKIKLDQYAQIIRANPKVIFKISGHTDSVGLGSDNFVLSESRINSVIQYFKKVHKLPEVRFIKLPYGEKNAIGDNKKDSERQRKRRVDIVQTEYSLSGAIYRNVLELVELKKIKNAFKLLNKWLNVAPQKQKIVMLYDPRLNSLKEDGRWQIISNKVKDSYKKYGGNKDLMYNLEILWAGDQKCRTLHCYIENLSVWIDEFDNGNQFLEITDNTLLSIDANNKDDYLPCADDNFIAKDDKTNFIKLQSLVGSDFLPEESNLSERAEKAIFLIIQHQSDIDILLKYLPKYKARCIEGESNWRYYALLYDRIQISKGLHQRYGTQFSNGKLCPLENQDSTDIWRNEIGLKNR